VDVHRLLSSSFDYYAQRSRDRLSGLTDEEYLWEPVPGCWSIRPAEQGWVSDGTQPAPEPAPVTTLAWRLVHVIYCLQDHGLRAVAFEGGKASWSSPRVVPATGALALEAFDGAVAAWKRDLDSTDNERLWLALGPEAGPYASDPVAAFVEHIHDELIHHMAEIALLRDLYRAGFRGS
jgi:uncharacterized damage-inducible protein DinB